ncbi:MAG: hypothetical protein AB7O73_03775 [Bacteroidia bacterium]
MYKKDYLVRQLESFSKFLGIVIGLRKNKDYQQFEEELEKLVSSFTNQELNSIRTESFSEFNERVARNPELNPIKIRMLADALFELCVSDIEKESNNENSILEKTFFLYQKYQSELVSNEFDLEVNYRIKFLDKLINPISDK